MACNDHAVGSFERGQWAEGDHRLRGWMVDDLLNKHQLKGITRTEVAQLLTIPRDTSDRTWTYHLGLGWTAMFHMDVHFDSLDDRVDSVQVWD